MYKRLLLLGDSQTQFGAAPHGWVNLVTHTYCRQLDVTNRGLSGYNTRWVLDNIASIIPPMPAYHFDLAVVWLGCNDAVKPGNCQHVAPEEYASNLTLLLCRLIDIGILPGNILVLTTTTVDERMLDKTWPGDRSRTNPLMKQYADIALGVAASRECAYSDVYTLFQEAGKRGEQVFADGLHLNKRGNELVAEVVRGFLSERIQVGFAIPDYKELTSEQ